MGCDAGRSCIHDHVFPRLKDPKPKGKDGYRAVAPCHDDDGHSLSISAGAGGRVIWHCFAGCSSDRVRNALILAEVSGRCLVRPAADLAADMDAIRAIIAGADSHAHKVLLIAALLGGYPELPPGQALESLAESCGVSGREAYKARRAGLHP
jgi:hypothetical protein